MLNNLIKLQPQCIRHRLSAQLNKPTATVTSLSLLELFIAIILIINTTKKQEKSSSLSRQSEKFSMLCLIFPHGLLVFVLQVFFKVTMGFFSYTIIAITTKHSPAPIFYHAPDIVAPSRQRWCRHVRGSLHKPTSST